MISVVTLAWRNEGFAAGFLTSLASSWNAAGRPEIEVIAVENGSEGTAAITSLSDCGEGTMVPVVIRVAENSGFSGGANAGVAKARGELVVVANLDLEFDVGFVAALCAVASQHWDLLVPAVLPLEHSSPGEAPVNSGPARRRLFHRHAWISPAPGGAQRVQAGSGSCLVLRRSTIDSRLAAVGGLFDREYHSFYEDVDLFWWAENRGLVALYDPSLVVRHALAGSFGGHFKYAARTAAIQEQLMANWRITVWKNARTPRDWFGWVVGELAYVAQAIVAAGPAGIGRYFRSWVDAVRDSRVIRRRRGALRA